MKIKRFTGSDMRQAIRNVRDALGADAVILSSSKTENGIEVVAAMDYDESLLNPADETSNALFENKEQHNEREVNRQAIWDDVRYGRNIPSSTTKPQANAESKKKSVAVDTGLINEEQVSIPAPTAEAFRLDEDHSFKEMQSEIRSLRGLLVNQLSGLAWENESKYHPVRARVLQRLIALGLSPKLAREISEHLEESEDIDHTWRMALGKLAHHLPVTDDDILNKKRNVVAIVGATGVGKTTTVAKLAARYILRHGKGRVGLITTDNYRVAAHEQLRNYAKILGAPMRVASDVESLQDALAAFHNKDLVLIDTAGMSQRDMRLNEQLGLLKESGHDIQVYLTLAANNQRGVMTDVAKSFNPVPLSGLILTKVDETTSLGGGLSIAAEQNIPIAYISDGQQVPEDLHPARAHALVSRAVTIMQDVGVGAKDDPISQMIGGMVAHANG